MVSFLFHKWGRFRRFRPRLHGPGHQPQEGIFRLKFVLETRQKINKIDLMFLVTTFEPEMLGS